MHRISILLSALALVLSSYANMSVNIEFDNSKFQSGIITVNDTTFSTTSYEGLPNSAEIGAASLPVKLIRYSVPYDATDFEVSATVVSSRTSRSLYAPYYNRADLAGINDSLSIITRPELEFDGLYTKLAEISDVSIIGGDNKVVTIAVYPVNYNALRKTYRYCTEINVSLSWSSAEDIYEEGMLPISSSNTTLKEADMSFARNIVINPDDIGDNTAPSISLLTTDQEDYTYIIIAPSALCNSLERLAEYRRLKGLGAKVFSIEGILKSSKFSSGDVLSGINDDAGKLRAFLSYAYRSYGTRYVLLAGSYPQMPIRTAAYGSGVPTDLYFGDLNGSWADIISSYNAYSVNRNLDFYEELNIGRIPFKTVDEVDSYIEKLKIYEFNPGLGDTSYLSKAFMSRQRRKLMDWGDNGGSDGYYRDDKIKSFTDFYSNGRLVDYTETYFYPKGADVISAINKTPCGMHNFIGHGNPGGVAVSVCDYGKYAGVVALDDFESWHLEEDSNGLDCLTNKAYPAWAYSIGCSTMPFDPENLDFKGEMTFGESYVLGKNYGGVAFIGNTRSSECPQGEAMMDEFFKQLKSASEDENEHYISASEILKRSIYFTNGSHKEKFCHNLYGDPMTCLWYDTPKKLSYISSKDNERYEYAISGNDGESLILSRQPLSDPTFSCQSVVKTDELGSIYVPDNEIFTLYEKNTIPLILPLHLQNFTFWTSLSRYIVADKVYCGRLVDPYSEEGTVTLQPNADITIESLSDVHIKWGTIFEKNSSLKIIADGNVYLGNITIPNGVTLYVEANTITTDNVTFEDGSIVTLIERNPKQKARAKASSVKGFVVEGKTWWYTSDYGPAGFDPLKTAEYGITIGEETEINGVKWNKFGVSLSSMRTDGVTTYDKTSYPIGYIRQDQNKIFYKIDWSGRFDPIYNYCVGNFSWDKDEIEVFYFGSVGDKFSFGGEDSQAMDYTIDGVSEITSCGYSYKLYKALGSSDRAWSFNFIESIGIGTPDRPNGLFFMPFGGEESANPRWEYPQLRYVTDPEQNIIYESIGGDRLWEKAAENDGVTDITVSNSAPSKFYNLQGVEVPAGSLSPGVYIKRTGSTAKKILVK